MHEYLEMKLVAEHGEADEKERPGITGSKPEEVQAAAIPDAMTQMQTDRQTDRSTDRSTDRRTD